MKYPYPRVVLLGCITLLSCLEVFGQFQFQRIYEIGSATTRGRSGIVTSDGGHLQSGSADFYPHLVRTDAAGDTLWSRRYTGSGDYDTYDVIETNDGGFVFTGPTNVLGQSTTEGYVLKVDAQGNVLWTTTFDAKEGRAVIETSDGNLVVVGIKLFAPNESTVIMKLDQAGTVLWSHEIFEATMNVQAWDVQETSDQGFIIAGRHVSTHVEAMLIKTDSLGNIQWQNLYGGTSNDGANAVDIAQNGDYIFTGYTESFGAGDWDAMVARVNSSGMLLWMRAYGDFLADEGQAILELQDQTLLLAADITDPGPFSTGILISHLDATGDTLTSSVLGGGLDETVGSLVANQVSGWTVFGRSNSFSLGPSYYVVKLDTSFESGCYELDANLTLATGGAQTLGNMTAVSPGTTVTANGLTEEWVGPNLSTTCQNGCPTPAVADFISAINSLTVDFTDQSMNAQGWLWDLGDGNTSSSQNPSHTYAAQGTYTVCLTVYGICDTTMSCQVVDLTSTGILSHSTEELVVYPNPSDGNFWVILDDVVGLPVELTIHSIDGKQVLTKRLSQSSESTVQLDASGLARGTYVLRLTGLDEVRVGTIIIR